MICYSILCLSSINLLGSWFLNRRRLYLQSPPPTSQLSSPLLVIEYEMEARTFAGEYSPPIFKTAMNVRFIRRCKSLLLLVPPFLPYSWAINSAPLLLMAIRRETPRGKASSSRTYLWSATITGSLLFIMRHYSLWTLSLLILPISLTILSKYSCLSCRLHNKPSKTCAPPLTSTLPGGKEIRSSIWGSLALSYPLSSLISNSSLILVLLLTLLSMDNYHPLLLDWLIQFFCKT